MVRTAKIDETSTDTSATQSASPERVTIPVTGMTCAACQSFIQRTLAAQAGVQDANVNLMMKNATVTFDPGVTSTSTLVDTIRGTGYGAELPCSPFISSCRSGRKRRRAVARIQAIAPEGRSQPDCRFLRDGIVHAADEREQRRRNAAHERPADELEHPRGRSCSSQGAAVDVSSERQRDPLVPLCSCSVHPWLGGAPLLHEGLVCPSAQDS